MLLLCNVSTGLPSECMLYPWAAQVWKAFGACWIATQTHLAVAVKKWILNACILLAACRASNEPLIAPCNCVIMTFPEVYPCKTGEAASLLC